MSCKFEVLSLSHDHPFRVSSFKSCGDLCLDLLTKDESPERNLTIHRKMSTTSTLESCRKLFDISRSQIEVYCCFRNFRMLDLPSLYVQNYTFSFQKCSLQTCRVYGSYLSDQRREGICQGVDHFSVFSFRTLTVAAPACRSVKSVQCREIINRVQCTEYCLTFKNTTLEGQISGHDSIHRPQ